MNLSKTSIPTTVIFYSWHSTTQQEDIVWIVGVDYVSYLPQVSALFCLKLLLRDHDVD